MKMRQSLGLLRLLDSLKEKGCWGANAQPRGFSMMLVNHSEGSWILCRPKEKTSSKP